MAEKGYPIEDDCLIDHRVAGLEVLLNPFGQFDSSPRLDMVSKHLTQALVMQGNEPPLIFSGYETEIGERCFDSSERAHDAEIISVIPKYLFTSSQYMTENPELTVIYRDIESKQIDYFTVSKYSKGTDGYGYYNTLINQHLLTPGTYLPKETRLIRSPANKGADYNLGTNVNVAYMTHPVGQDDAFGISRSFANKATTKSVRTMTIRIPPNQHPLNLYGDELEIKFMPDIGERVREDGIICGFRTPTNTTFMADTLSSRITKPQYLHDKLYRAPSGAVVVDINCYMNRVNTPKHLWVQVDKYILADINYFKSVVDVYQTYKHHDMSSAFNTLVTRAMSRLVAHNQHVKDIPHKSACKLANKESQIDFLQIDIVYAYDLKISNGFKFTDRHGHKGVIAKIYEDEDMPVDDHGFRADIIVDPIAPENRMNYGQLYEQYINRISEFVRRQLATTKDFNYVLDYINTIYPTYASIVERNCPTPEHKQKFVEDCIRDGIRLFIPFACKYIGFDLIEKLEAKYGSHATPVTYYTRDEYGNREVVRTKCNVLIGSKYMYLLYKVPKKTAVGFGYINQYQTPIAPSKANKMTAPLSQTPIRFGEDEHRIEVATCPIEAVVRQDCLQANSILGVNKLAETILTAKKPTQIQKVPVTNKELLENNAIIGIAHHVLKTAGIESYDVDTDPLTEDELFTLGV